MDELESNNIENILALRGDIPKDKDENVYHEGDFLYASDLVKEIRATNRFSVGGAFYPEVHRENNDLIEIILEPYTRKYGVKLVYGGSYDLIVNPIILDSKVNSIFSDIFKGNGLTFSNKTNEIYPLINVPLNWINSFLEMDGKKIIETKDYDDLSTSFMEFLEDVAPQYRENVLKAYEYIEKELEVE